jgi:hypothetical protein
MFWGVIFKTLLRSLDHSSTGPLYGDVLNKENPCARVARSLRIINHQSSTKSHARHKNF